MADKDQHFILAIETALETAQSMSMLLPRVLPFANFMNHGSYFDRIGTHIKF